MSYKWFNVTSPAEYVTHVEINRANKLNAFHEPMWLELRDIFNTLSHCPDTRAIILSGAGDKAFTAGLDVEAASQSGPLSTSPDSAFTDGRPAVKPPLPLDPARTGAAIRRHLFEFQDSVTAIERCAKPVLVVLHGYSYGLAIDIAVATDIRIAASDVRLCVKEVDIGIAADVGTLTRLPKIVGSYSWVKEVCLTAREFGAREAERVGFVSVVADGGKEAAFAKAVELASNIARKSPVAVQGTKELLNFSRDRTVEDGLHYTAAWAGANIQSRDVVEAMTANIKKRKPTFEKL